MLDIFYNFYIFLQWYWYTWANKSGTRLSRTDSTAYYARVGEPGVPPRRYEDDFGSVEVTSKYCLG